jgi:hypothetical protein
MADKKIFYIISYRDPKDNKTLELKAKKVTDSTLGLSFIAISEFIFDSGALVVNPAEEDLKRKLEHVKTLHISIYSILSIEEVGAAHRGLKFKKNKSNLIVLNSSQKSPTEK